MMDAKLTRYCTLDTEDRALMTLGMCSTDITKHAAQQTVQPWHSKENKSQYWNQLTGQVTAAVTRTMTFMTDANDRWRRRGARARRGRWRRTRPRRSTSRCGTGSGAGRGTGRPGSQGRTRRTS